MMVLLGTSWELAREAGGSWTSLGAPLLFPDGPVRHCFNNQTKKRSKGKGVWSDFLLFFIQQLPPRGTADGNSSSQFNVCVVLHSLRSISFRSCCFFSLNATKRVRRKKFASPLLSPFAPTGSSLRTKPLCRHVLRKLSDGKTNGMPLESKHVGRRIFL